METESPGASLEQGCRPESEAVGLVHICQGPPRCHFDGNEPEKRMPCPYCKTVRGDDPDPADMGRTQ